MTIVKWQLNFVKLALGRSESNRKLCTDTTRRTWKATRFALGGCDATWESAKNSTYCSSLFNKRCSAAQELRMGCGRLVVSAEQTPLLCIRECLCTWGRAGRCNCCLKYSREIVFTLETYTSVFAQTGNSNLVKTSSAGGFVFFPLIFERLRSPEQRISGPTREQLQNKRGWKGGGAVDCWLGAIAVWYEYSGNT